MFAFFVEHIVEIIFGLISAGALAFCKQLSKKNKEYQTLLSEKKEAIQLEEMEELIEKHISPLTERIVALEASVNNFAAKEKNDISLVISSWRYRLIQLCEECIGHGYITQKQYSQITEFFRLYSDLGGNGQAQDYYTRAINLPLRSEDD